MPETDLRQLKREAYSKYHPPSGSGGGRTSGSGGGMMRSDGGVRSNTGGVGRNSGPPGLGGVFGFGNGGKVRGQPNMGARMGVLLEQIQRDRSQKI